MIGNRLKQKIAELRLTQQQTADKLGISQSRLNQYLKDKREPDSQMLCHICRSLAVTPNFLFGFDDALSTQSVQINKDALETAIAFTTAYASKNKKRYSPEQQAKIITVLYEIILTETPDTAKIQIERVLEAVA